MEELGVLAVGGWLLDRLAILRALSLALDLGFFLPPFLR